MKQIFTQIKNALLKQGIQLEDVIYSELVSASARGELYSPLAWEDVVDEFLNHADHIGIDAEHLDPESAAAFIIEAKEQFCQIEDDQYADEAREYIAHLALQRTAMACDLIARRSYDEIARENGDLAFNVIPVAVAVAAEDELVNINISGADLKEALIAACTSYYDEAGNGVGPMMDSAALLDPALVAFILDAAQEHIEAGAKLLVKTATALAIKQASKAGNGKGWDHLIAIQ